MTELSVIPNCEGFTRPECKPCLQPAARRTDYIALGVKERKFLCSVCISRLLLGDATGWSLP